MYSTISKFAYNEMLSEVELNYKFFWFPIKRCVFLWVANMLFKFN